MSPAFKYTLGRVVIFVVFLAVLTPIPLNLLVKLMIALFASAGFSYFLLARWRNEMAEQLGAAADRRKRERTRLRAALAGDDAAAAAGDRVTAANDRTTGAGDRVTGAGDRVAGAGDRVTAAAGVTEPSVVPPAADEPAAEQAEPTATGTEAKAEGTSGARTDVRADARADAGADAQDESK